MSAARGRAFVNARVWTGDGAVPYTDAFTVEGGTIVAVGDAGDLAGVDLGGAFVTPGIHDAHMHLATGALLRSRIDLSAATSAEDAAERIAGTARLAPEGDWIRAWGWDHTRWPGSAWPQRALLDRAAPRHPVVATRIDGHTAWVNTQALARLGEGQALQHAGILMEQDAERAVAAIPEPSDSVRRGALEDALREARSVGITSLEDVTEPWALPLYGSLRDEGALTARVTAWLPIDTPRALALELRGAFPPEDPWVRVTTLKVFLDGTLGSRSAALWAPYADDPSESGILRVDPPELVEKVRAAAADGWTIALHAIGDRALSVALDALEPLPRQEPLRAHRIEHVQVAARRDLARMRDAGVVASIQPVHFLDDRAWIAARLGTRPDALAYPWRTLIETGIGVAFGSDWPIASMDPRRGILAATDRADFLPTEALTPEQALAGYTSGSAAARGQGSRAGVLRPGLPADFVVWSKDPRSITSVAADDTCRVRFTYVAGRRVWPEIER